jgi:hypothetical protein
MAEARVNLLANNLLMKQIVAVKEAGEEQKQRLLMQVAELLYQDNGAKSVSTRRLAKVMFYAGLLIDQVGYDKKA